MIHNLKTPLSTLHALFASMSNKDSIDKTVILKEAEAVINEMDHTISKLDKFLAKKKHEEDPQEINFYEFFNQLRESGRIEDLPEEDITINFENCPSVIFPEAYLKTFFLNLINNATANKSARRPFHIYVSTQKLGEYVLLTFRDNGRGINVSSGKDGLIFTPQKRTNEDGSSMPDLNLVKILVEKNGGHLVVDSKTKVGTTFTLYLKEYNQ